MLQFNPKRSGNLDCDLNVSISHTSGRWSIKGDLIANKVCHGSWQHWNLHLRRYLSGNFIWRRTHVIRRFRSNEIHFKLVTDRWFMSPVYVQKFRIKKNNNKIGPPFTAFSVSPSAPGQRAWHSRGESISFSRGFFSASLPGLCTVS